MCQLHVPTTCASYVCVYQLHGNRMESNSRANIWKKRFPKTRSVKPVLLSLELKTPSRCLKLRKPWAPSRGQSTSQRSPSRSCSMCVCVMLCLSLRRSSGCSLFTASGAPGSHQLPQHARCYNPSLCYMCESLEVNKTVSRCPHPLQWHRLLEGPCFLLCLSKLLFLLLFFLLIYIMTNNLYRLNTRVLTIL